MSIATLGPKGTCSEAAAVSYLNQRNLSREYPVILFPTFEEVIDNLIAQKAKIAIIPCAYVNYNKLLFANLGNITIHDIMQEQTPPFVLASLKSASELNTSDEFTIASHPSPAPLMDKLPYKTKATITKSNVISAQMALNGEVDLCITTTKAIKALEDEPNQKNKLNIINHYGPADMVWIIFSKLGAN